MPTERLSLRPNRPRASDRHPSGLRATTRALVLVALVALHVSLAAAFDLSLTTANDVLVQNPTPDDYYTFGVAFELVRGPYVLYLRENAFTDRAAGVRFDETHLGARRSARAGRWSLVAEAGVVRVGHGLFGERTQNSLHGVIGADQVDLRYSETSHHVSLLARAERVQRTARRVALGPRFEVFAAPGLRSHAEAGARVIWDAGARVLLDVEAGGRFSHATLAPLEPHVVRLAPVARVGVVLVERLELSWSYNEYGDGREQVSLGYRIPLGDTREGSPTP